MGLGSSSARVTERSAAPLDGAGGVEVADGRNAPPARALADEERSRIQHALAGLDADQRRMIEYAYYEGLSHAEIAQRMDKSLGAVRSGIRQGLAHLRTKLKAE
jgi:RNA polymerase sigma-70 factor (ECF subfamily)